MGGSGLRNLGGIARLAVEGTTRRGGVFTGGDGIVGGVAFKKSA